MNQTKTKSKFCTLFFTEFLRMFWTNIICTQERDKELPELQKVRKNVPFYISLSSSEKHWKMPTLVISQFLAIWNYLKRSNEKKVLHIYGLCHYKYNFFHDVGFFSIARESPLKCIYFLKLPKVKFSLSDFSFLSNGKIKLLK